MSYCSENRLDIPPGSLIRAIPHSIAFPCWSNHGANLAPYNPFRKENNLGAGPVYPLAPNKIDAGPGESLYPEKESLDLYGTGE